MFIAVKGRASLNKLCGIRKFRNLSQKVRNIHDINKQLSNLAQTENEYPVGKMGIRDSRLDLNLMAHPVRRYEYSDYRI